MSRVTVTASTHKVPEEFSFHRLYFEGIDRDRVVGIIQATAMDVAPVMGRGIVSPAMVVFLAGRSSIEMVEVQELQAVGGSGSRADKSATTIRTAIRLMVTRRTVMD